MLTIDRGVSVSNNAATSTTPSAEIDAPIASRADPVTMSTVQTWEVDPGQFLQINGQVSGAGITMTKTGSGNAEFAAPGGSLGTLDVAAGIVLLKAAKCVGNATLELDGGGVQYIAVDSGGNPTTFTATNPITVTSAGGLFGNTTGTVSVSGETLTRSAPSRPLARARPS